MVNEVGISGAGGKMSNRKSLHDHAAVRQNILASLSVEDTANEARNMRKLSAVEKIISSWSFQADADKLTGQRILMDMGDRPNALDDFKVALFGRMQEFA